MVWTVKENDLLTVIKKGSISEINQAIQDGADVNATDNGGWTPLTFALHHEAPKEVIELLIAKGADVNAKDKDGWTPLMHALYNKASKEVIELLRTNADMKANLAKSEQKNANLKQKIDEQNAQIAYNNFLAKKKEKQRMTKLMLGKYRH